MITTIFTRVNRQGLLRRFSIFERTYGSTHDIILKDYGEAYEFYMNKLKNNYDESSKDDNIKDENIIRDLRLLRGMRFGMDHADKLTQEGIKILASRARFCDEDYFHQYLLLFNLIGFRDERLYSSFFDSIKHNFEGMKYTNQLKTLYYWTRSEIFIYSAEIEDRIKKRFFDRSTRRYEKLSEDELAMLIWVLHSWGVGIDNLLEYQEENVDFNNLIGEPVFELNRMADFTILMARKTSESVEEAKQYDDLSDSYHNTMKLIESFSILSPIQYDNILRETDNKYSHEKTIGAFDPVTAVSSYQCFKACELIGLEAREFNHQLEEIVTRKLEIDLIDLNSSAKLLTLEPDQIKPDTKTQVYQNIIDIMEAEPGIVPISILPENLDTIVKELLSDLNTRFISATTLRGLSTQLLGMIAYDHLDEHLSEIEDLAPFKLLADRSDLGVSDSIKKLALENIELNDI